WSAGECCGRALEKNVNDIAFLDALVAHIEATSCTTGRVLATGLGNGAMMADAWACESDVPDAVVAVGGELQAPECRNPRPIPSIHVHATEDPWSAPDGSTGHRP